MTRRAPIRRTMKSPAEPPPQDLDACIADAEARLVARQEQLRLQWNDLRARVEHATQPRRLALPVVAAALSLLALWWLLRRPEPAREAQSRVARTTASAWGSRWLRWAAFALPLLPLHWRARLPPTTVGGILSLALPLVRRAWTDRRCMPRRPPRWPRSTSSAMPDSGTRSPACQRVTRRPVRRSRAPNIASARKVCRSSTAAAPPRAASVWREAWRASCRAVAAPGWRSASRRAGCTGCRSPGPITGSCTSIPTTVRRWLARPRATLFGCCRAGPGLGRAVRQAHGSC